MNRPVLNQKEHIITPQHEHASTNKQAVQFKDYRSEAAVQSKFQKLATNNTIVQRQANFLCETDNLPYRDRYEVSRLPTGLLRSAGPEPLREGRAGCVGAYRALSPL